MKTRLNDLCNARIVEKKTEKITMDKTNFEFQQFFITKANLEIHIDTARIDTYSITLKNVNVLVFKYVFLYPYK